MKRLVLLAVLTIALPVPHAVACTPAPPNVLTLSRDRAAPGVEIRVSGEEIRDADGTSRFDCPTGSPLAPATPTPRQTTEPLVSLPPIPPVVPLPASDVSPSVRVRIASVVGWPAPQPPERDLAVAPVTQAPYDEEGHLRFAFETTVTIPRDLTPGRYGVRAYREGWIDFGYAEIEVIKNLASSGADLDRLALLAMLTGAAVLVLSRRAAGSSPRRG